MQGVYFIAGIYGIGKTTLGRQLSQQFGISFYEASELIKKHNGEEYGAIKHVKNVNRNQEILIEEVSKILKQEKAIILAGHFAIFTKERLVEVIPEKVFQQLNLTSIILLETSVNHAMRHLKGRDNKNYTAEELSTLAAEEKRYCLRAVKKTGAKLIIHQMNYVNDVDVIKKNILEGECK